MRKLTIVSFIIAASFSHYVHQEAYAAEQKTEDEMYDKCGDLLQNTHSALQFKDVNMAKDVLADPDHKQCLFPEYITMLHDMINKNTRALKPNIHRPRPKPENHVPQQKPQSQKEPEHYSMTNTADAVQYRHVYAVSEMKSVCAAAMYVQNRGAIPAELWNQVNSVSFNAGNWWCKITYQTNPDITTAVISPYQLPD